jgi:hypothetical protein
MTTREKNEKWSLAGLCANHTFSTWTLWCVVLCINLIWLVIRDEGVFLFVAITFNLLAHGAANCVQEGQWSTTTGV